MKFLNKLERKFGKYAIPNLIKYVLVLYAVGTLIGSVNPNFYIKYLCLDFEMVMRGQIWRLVTFLMAPYGSINSFIGILLFLLEVYLYYMIGNALEQAWGTFRSNLYIYSGILFNIIAALVIYIVCDRVYDTNVIYTVGLEYIFQALFFAFAFLYPNTQLMLWMVIPIKVKYLGYLNGILMAYQVVTCFMSSNIYVKVNGIAILVAVANFFLFVLWSLKAQRPTRAQVKRRREFKKEVRTMAGKAGEPRHRCAICGRTEQDNPNLEFRFCSKCDGNYEYCSDHLFTHEHVKR